MTRTSLLLAAMAMSFTTSAFAQSSQPAPEAAAPAAPAPAPAPVVDPNQPYQVLRATDRDLTCEQLAAESNDLNAWLLANHKSEVKKAEGAKTKAGLLHAAGKFGISRMPGLGGFGGMGVKAAQEANDTAANAVAQSGQPTGEVTPQQQRMNRLMVLFKDKGC
jgi:type IV secretory pathway VirB10-like protein